MAPISMLFSFHFAIPALAVIAVDARVTVATAKTAIFFELFHGFPPYHTNSYFSVIVILHLFESKAILPTLIPLIFTSKDFPLYLL